MNRPGLQQLSASWRRHLWLRAVVAGALGADAAYLLAGGGAAIFVFAATLVALLLRARPWGIDASGVAQHLDRSLPALEESSHLWLREPTGLTRLERLQRSRIDAAFTPQEQRRFTPATRNLIPLLLVALGIPLLLASITYVPALQRFAPKAETPAPGSTVTTAPVPASPPLLVTEAQLIITPPAYTGRPPRRVSGFEAEVEAGASVEWRFTFSAPANDVQLRANAAAPIALKSLDATHATGSAVINELTLYALATPTRALPGTHALRVIGDRAPVIAISEPRQVRTELAAAAPVPIAVQVTDDYGVANAWLVATVAKGTGEAVKFREQKFAFATTDGPGTRRSFTTTLDLPALGLAAGDELYFHVEALDNRTPAPNLARSETHFLIVKGTQTTAASAGRGIAGVNLVPEYFRSQRQLIIDTEKLIADRPTLSERSFRERSNELGIDQQLLRLRYGKFLGEEAEGEIARPAEALKTNAAGIPESMIHRHDSAHDHNHGQPGAEKTPDAAPKDAKDVIAPFVHQHDSQDEATFFDGQTKGTLRDVLSAMWEAEGFLRVAKPAESLPAQNRALAILKFLQQGDRAYVQRVGFEPAPLKIGERRLQGDISALARAGRVPAPEIRPDEALQIVRAALGTINFSALGAPLSEAEQIALRAAEPALARAAAQSSESALTGLQALRQVLAEGGRDRRELPAVGTALWKLLPGAHAVPRRAREPAAGLAEKYFEALAEDPR